MPCVCGRGLQHPSRTDVCVVFLGFAHYFQNNVRDPSDSIKLGRYDRNFDRDVHHNSNGLYLQRWPTVFLRFAKFQPMFRHIPLHLQTRCASVFGWRQPTRLCMWKRNLHKRQWTSMFWFDLLTPTRLYCGKRPNMQVWYHGLYPNNRVAMLWF